MANVIGSAVQQEINKSMDNVMTLATRLKVMKPNKINKDNIKQQVKLDALLDSEDYWAEEKIDGCHYKMLGCRFFSQENIEKTDNFVHLRDYFMTLGMVNLILDGEINYPGKTSQFCVSVTGADPAQAIKFQDINGYIHYTIFDMLRTPKGTWLLNYTYEERRKVLYYFYEHYVKGTAMEPYIHISASTKEDKRNFLENILDTGAEGVVLKRAKGFYVLGKKPMWEWMKIKQADETDLIITGFKDPKKEYTGTNYDAWPYWVEENGINLPVTENYAKHYIGSIILSAYVKGQLKEICTCSGMDMATRIDMTTYPDKYLGRVARVSFMERTTAGYPRHPVYINLHEDKVTTECTWVLNEAE